MHNFLLTLCFFLLKDPFHMFCNIFLTTCFDIFVISVCRFDKVFYIFHQTAAEITISLLLSWSLWPPLHCCLKIKHFMAHAVLSFEAAPFCDLLPDIPHLLTGSIPPLTWFSTLHWQDHAEPVIPPGVKGHLSSVSEECHSQVCKQACVAVRMQLWLGKGNGCFFHFPLPGEHSS